MGAALEGRARELAQQWWRSTRIGSELDAEPRVAAEQARAETLISAVAAALHARAMWHDAVMRTGWQFGCEAHRQRLPLHFVLEELDALTTMLLLAAGDASAATGAGAAEGLAVARRISSGVSTLRLAATKGYTHSVVDELRRHYRHLRHGLRNPLGTIKSALALMDDETMPEEARRSGRFLAMAERNAKSLDAIIGQALGDQAALLPAFARGPVSLRAIACAVRRDLGAEAGERRIAIIVGDGLPAVQIDSAGVELILRSVVTALLREVRGPAEVVVNAAHLTVHSATITVSVKPAEALARPLDIGALPFAHELAAGTGGQLWVDAQRRLCVEVPISAAEPLDDVRRPRQGPDLESRIL